MAYKLIYFDAAGRGEPARLIFAAAGVPFEDQRVGGEKWAELKPTIEGGQLPVLQVGDKFLAESKAIFRYLGRKFKLDGKDEWEAAKCDEIVDSFGSVLEEWVQFTFIEKDEGKKEELKKKFEKESLPAKLTRYSKLIEKNGKWLVGQNMTWADIVIAQSIHQITEGKWDSIVDAHPLVRKLINEVFAQEGIKKYKNAAK